jgi:ribosomal protein S18 acetylase RimI-like enzyme
MSSCSFEDALRTWNEAFQDYFVNLTLSLEGYVARLQREGLSPEHSLMAFCDGRPAGFLLNGLRMVAGKRVAWNGGTGVSPEFRRRGLAKALLQAALDIYRQHGVDLATLEAIKENESAISLYRQVGYEIVDQLLFLQHDGKLDERSIDDEGLRPYSIQSVAPQAVSKLSFYPSLVPWQAQWQSVSLNNGEALVVTEADGAVVGFALYKKKTDEQENVSSIALYQCIAGTDGASAEAVLRRALKHLYGPLDLDCRRTTHSLGRSSLTVQQMLRECGFTPFVEQFHMVRRFDSVNAAILGRTPLGE